LTFPAFSGTTLIVSGANSIVTHQEFSDARIEFAQGMRGAPLDKEFG